MKRVSESNSAITKLWPPQTKRDIDSKQSDMSGNTNVSSLCANSTSSYTALKTPLPGCKSESAMPSFAVPSSQPRQQFSKSKTVQQPKASNQKTVKNLVHTCDQCDYQTQHKMRMRTHILKNHSTETLGTTSTSTSGKVDKRFKCNYCSYFYVTAGRLQSHVKRWHVEDKLKCDLESETASSSESCPTQFYKCLSCKFTVEDQVKLHRHYVSHAVVIPGKRPSYQCLVKGCSHSTSSIHVFMKHCRLKHNSYIGLNKTHLKPTIA